MKEPRLTPDQRNTIVTLLRRGEQVSHISSVMHVRREDVEQVLEQCVVRAMK